LAPDDPVGFPVQRNFIYIVDVAERGVIVAVRTSFPSVFCGIVSSHGIAVPHVITEVVVDFTTCKTLPADPIAEVDTVVTLPFASTEITGIAVDVP
jgi:hypothetical protein